MKESVRDEGADPRVDATTILENLIELDQLLDERSRRDLGALPYLELSKYVKIRKG
jgi:hypothetical protein